MSMKVLGDLCLMVRIIWTPVFRSKLKQRKKLAWPRPKWILGVLLLAPALPVSTEADVPMLTILSTPAAVVPKPISAESLAAFMHQKGFVQPYHLPEIIQAASQAAIPPSMIVCIEFVESSGGKHYDADT